MTAGMAVLLDDGLRLELTRQDVIVYQDGVDVPEFGAGAPIDSTFVQAIRTGDRSLILSDYRDGLVSCAVTLAANESAEKGQPVVPFFARQSG